MTEFEITDAMMVFGGSFVSGLGRLWRVADADNRRRLADAFPEYWAKYEAIAEAAAVRAVMRQPYSHYCPMDSPAGPDDTQLAICQRWVDPRVGHALDPTCPDCQKILAEDDASLAALRT